MSSYQIMGDTLSTPLSDSTSSNLAVRLNDRVKNAGYNSEILKNAFINTANYYVRSRDNQNALLAEKDPALIIRFVGGKNEVQREQQLFFRIALEGDKAVEQANIKLLEEKEARDRPPPPVQAPQLQPPQRQITPSQVNFQQPNVSMNPIAPMQGLNPQMSQPVVSMNPMAILSGSKAPVILIGGAAVLAAIIFFVMRKK